MKFDIPNYVKKIIVALTNAGFEAYVVGGAVRDLLLGKEPKDFDMQLMLGPTKLS